MVDQEKLNQVLAGLAQRRDERIDLLPDQGDFTDVIADAMNALEVAYATIMSSIVKQSPQGAVFVPVSNPGEQKPL